MKKNLVGLIVEYNPLHNGHLHHIQKIDELIPNNLKIAVMSGDFVQRGEPSILNKFDKTRIALSEGIDIVVELPSFCSAQSAEIFARTSISLLDRFSCNFLIFGSESNNLENLKNTKDFSETTEFKEKLKNYLAQGLSYPTAMAYASNSNNLKSNDILGLEYLKAIDFHNSPIIPMCIQRKNAGYYDSKNENFASASYIRKVLLGTSNEVIENKFDYLKDIIPLSTLKYLSEQKTFVNLEDFYDLIRFEIIKNYKELNNIQDMEIGLDNRLYKAALEFDNFLDFFNFILSKRFTISRLQRVLTHILLGITKDITNEIKYSCPYAKILGFSKAGREYINSLKKEENFKERKIITSTRNLDKNLNQDELTLFQLNELHSSIYKLKSDYKSINYVIIDEENEKNNGGNL